MACRGNRQSSQQQKNCEMEKILNIFWYHVSHVQLVWVLCCDLFLLMLHSLLSDRPYHFVPKPSCVCNMGLTLQLLVKLDKTWYKVRILKVV